MDLHEFHFLRPLWLLALLPLMLALWRLMAKRHDTNPWHRLVDAHLLPHLLAGQKKTIQTHLPLVLLGLGWLIAVLALAGPVWERLPTPLYQTTAYRVLVLDLSATMNAADLPPSRLTHARFKVLDMLQRAQEGHTALLAYGAEPYVVSPLTADVHTIEEQVSSLETALLPVQGTKNTALALQQAGKLLRQAGALSGDIILITDGLAQPAAAREAAAALRQAGYSVSALGMGTPTGAPIPLPSGGFMKDSHGSILLSKLDQAGLRDLASAGGGRYMQAGLDDRDVQILMMATHSLGHEGKPRQSETTADVWREEGPWLLLALLPLAALAFRRGWLTVLLLVPLLGPPRAEAFSWADLWLRPDQQGARAMESKDYAQAAQQFQRPDWRAAAQYAAGDYSHALQTLGTVGDPAVHYNRGNALAQSGQLNEALAEYGRALAADPNDEDARHNRDLIRKLLQDQNKPQPSAKNRQEANSPAADTREPPPVQGGRNSQRAESKTAEGPKPRVSQSKAQEKSSTSPKNAAAEEETKDPNQNPGATSESSAATGSRSAVEQPAAAANPRERSESDAQQSPDQIGRQPKSISVPQPAEAAHPQNEPGQEPRPADLLSENPPQTKPQSTATLDNNAATETHQALEQMLRRVPDDPGGLLRQRFLLQHLRRSGRLP